MKKDYQKPEIEFISLAVKETVTSDDLMDDDTVIGVESSIF